VPVHGILIAISLPQFRGSVKESHHRFSVVPTVATVLDAILGYLGRLNSAGQNNGSGRRKRQKDALTNASACGTLLTSRYCSNP